MAWANALPSATPSRNMADSHFRDAVTLWLGGRTNEEKGLVGLKCPCSREACPSSGPSHMGSCSIGAGGHRIGRHDAVKKDLEALCKEAGLTTALEPRVYEDDEDEDDERGCPAIDGGKKDKRRTDLRVMRLLVDAPGGKKGEHRTEWIDAQVDVAVVDGSSQSGTRAGSSTTRGAYAERTAKWKKARYEEVLKGKGFVFMPFVVETSGFFHEGSLKFIRLLSEHVTNTAQVGKDVSRKELAILRATLVNRFLQRLSTSARSAVVTCVQRASIRLALRPSSIKDQRMKGSLPTLVSARAHSLIGAYLRSACSSGAGMD